MKTILPIALIITLIFAGCNECKPDLGDWETGQLNMRSVVDLYETNQLLFGNGNARVERVIPDSLRINEFDTLVYVNVGSRASLNDGTFTVRFYKIDKSKNWTKEIVYTTQVSELKKLNSAKCCVNVAPNWYIHDID